MSLPKATFEKILKATKKHIRVSDKAAEALAKQMEEQAVALAKDAVVLAEHAGRKTILEEDVLLAVKRKK